MNGNLLAGLAVLAALLATSVGLAVEEAATDERRTTFPLLEAPLAAQATAVPLAGAELNWTLPDNATAAAFTVTVTFTGQAFLGGSATIALEVLGPEGRLAGHATASLAIAVGATSASAMVDVEGSWGQAPSDSIHDPDDLPAPQRWQEPVLLRIRVEPPGDLPAATYGFNAEVSGVALRYQHQFG